MANHSRPIVLGEVDRVELERIQRSSTAHAGLSRRARVVLLLADDVSGAEVARMTGYTVVQISRLRRRFAEQGLAGLADRARSGRPTTIPARKRARVVAMTLKPPEAGLSHWSSRELASEVGVSHSTVHRIWQEHDLQPHRIETFKFSTDPEPSLPKGRSACHPRQLVDPQDPGGEDLVGGAASRSLPLHSDRCLMAQHGRSVVQHPDAQVGSPRFLRHGAGTHQAHPPIHLTLE